MKRNRLLSRMILASATFGLTATVGVVSTQFFLGSAPVANAAESAAQSAATKLKVEKGDHIAILGNTLADRMQHDGWLDTLIHARFPEYNLSMRNLSAAADEVSTWHRSENFGTRDEWLAKTKASVVFAFYGFNESFKGDTGLDKFKTDLEKFIKDMKAANFSGKGAPRVVLFSPIAAEKLADTDHADPAPINANLKKYSAVMAEVAKANDVAFVDLLNPSLRLFEEAATQKKALTIDGIHLTQEADKKLAPEIFQELFGETAPSADFEKLREAVIARNEEWHSRYRTVDGYNVYGGRSKMAYNNGPGGPKITNYQVMQEEMSVRDVMTANAEQIVWSVASGGVLPVKPAPLPPVEKIGTNMQPKDISPYLDGQEAISKMTVAKGCKVNLFADEKMWPELVNPLQMMWDTKGRLWVSSWKNYPERTPDSTDGDKILILEDTKGTGKADKMTVFMDGLNCPTGFQFYKNGILLMQAPDLWYVPIGPDGKADKAHMERVLMGMDSADSHHTTNSMVLDPGGATYLSDGVFHRTQVETAQGPVHNTDGCVYRFEPRTGKFERYAAYGFANPHGRVFDYWGNDIITDATGNASYFAPAFSGHIDEPAKHGSMEQFWKRPSRPCPGTGMVSSRHFPDDWQENFLNCNVIGFQGIYRVKMTMQGSGLRGESLEDLISSSDPNFRPSQVFNGPDGALYVSDWSQVIIGHLQHHLRDPERGHSHGRIYRITYEGRPLLKQPKIDGQPVAALLDLLKEPEDGVRMLAKIELGKHEASEVIAAVKGWAAALDKNDPAYQHHLTEALWVHQWFNVMDEALLKQVLRSPEPNARAAATRVLCYMRDAVPSALDLLKVQSTDESPRVRLEAVRAASFFRDIKAADVALSSMSRPSDYYLDYCLKETMKQLDPLVKEAVAAGKIISNDPAAVAYLTRSIKTADLLKMSRTPALLQAILSRADVTDADRTTALVELSTQQKVTPAALLTSSVEAASNEPASGAAMSRMLPMLPQDQLVPLRDRLLALANNGTSLEVRAAGWAAVVAADGSYDKVWAEGEKSPAKLVDVLSSVPLVNDQDLRATVAPRVNAYLAPQLPSSLTSAAKGQAVSGRYVRIELPKKGTLALAEVQVFSGGHNIALNGKATQSTTYKGGEASKAIDGKIDGAFGNGSMSHTEEADKKPWWQVDLGGEYPIDSIVIWNRSEENGKYVKRLEGFTLAVLDAHKKATFEKDNNPAPSEDVKFQVSADELGGVRRAAIKAAVSLAKDPGATFKSLAILIQNGDHVTAAAKGMRALPRTAWGKDDAGATAKALVAWGKNIPAGERSDEENLQTMQLADELASSLPPAEATELRKTLKELRVAVFVVNTVREQMRYDTPRLVVEAGKPFEIIFVNPDFMPHNLVIVNPGKRSEIGAASATMKPDDLDSQGRAYIPKSRDVLAGTKLIEAGQKVKFNVNAPGKEGEYEYVCTFPGHWELMWGKLVVTKDVDTYLAAHPDAGPVGNGAAAGHVHEHGK